MLLEELDVKVRIISLSVMMLAVVVCCIIATLNRQGQLSDSVSSRFVAGAAAVALIARIVDDWLDRKGVPLVGKKEE